MKYSPPGFSGYKPSPVHLYISIYADESLKLLEMRLLTMLATAVLLAGCVHDTDDFTLFVAESGVSLTYYIGSDGDGSQKDHDDPWHVISEKFPLESVHTGLGKVHDDPWTKICELFPAESAHSRKSDHDDPWTQISHLFPSDAVHVDKANDHYFLGFEKSVAVFVSFTYEVASADRARVVEIRGNVLKLEFADGVVQYVIDAPASWTEGTQLETGFVDATTKKDRPFLGVRFWQTIQGSDWRARSGSPIVALPVSWPRENQVSGASLLVGLPVGHKSHDDPWTRICSLFGKSGEEHDDPWNSIRTLFPDESVHVDKNFDKHDDPWDVINESFPLESVHTGSGKGHDDPWDRVNENFGASSTHTGKKNLFRGYSISRMLFVSCRREGGETDDPWNRIGELFPAGGVKATADLTLVEVRGVIGRFEFEDGGSLFAVGVPEEWQPGVRLLATGYLLQDAKFLPLAGAVVWDVDPTLR
jgi:hypothetical protein